MAKYYLKGSDVESTSSKQLPRLLGIAHETYEEYCINVLENSNYGNRVTKYCFTLVQNETTQEYALEVDDTQDEYDSLPSIHTNRLVSKASMEADGWEFDE